MTLPELRNEKKRIENEIKDVIDRELIPLLDEQNINGSVSVYIERWLTAVGGINKAKVRIDLEL